MLFGPSDTYSSSGPVVLGTFCKTLTAVRKWTLILAKPPFSGSLTSANQLLLVFPKPSPFTVCFLNHCLEPTTFLLVNIFV